MPLGGLGTAALIAGGSQALTGIISGISGLGQKARARRMEKENKRPIQAMPSEIEANKKLAEMYASQGMPAEQYAQAIKNIGRNTANALNASSDRRGTLSAVGGIAGKANEATGNLDAQSAAMRVNNLSRLMSANQIMAAYRDKLFQTNEMQPYQEKAAAIRALKSAGDANINQGIQSIMGGALTAADGGLFGGKGGNTGVGTSSVASSNPMINRLLDPNAAFRSRAFNTPSVFNRTFTQPFVSPNANMSTSEIADDIAEQDMYPNSYRDFMLNGHYGRY